MPGKIVQLPADLTDKIAAGEVIERPASIVKELIENALDAGADDITIELSRGGCSIIKVTDNGGGIDRDDAALAFSRYATSKIYTFEDIYHVQSFGFRGEALASIASVSRVEMITKRHNALIGTKVIVEAGEMQAIAEAGCPSGTSILVSKIFDPVPVRRKFLKSETVEQGHCVDVITRLSLAHPEIRFTIIANGREILSLPSTHNAAERLAVTLGADTLKEMIPISAEKDGIRLAGFTSHPSLTRANTKHLYFYVNKRFIKDHFMNHAIMTAYRNIIEAKRYPVVVMMLDLSPEDLDVNVHPAKLEVRFRNPRGIYETIIEAFAHALRGTAAVEKNGERNSYAPLSAMPDHFSRLRVEEALKRYTLSSRRSPIHFDNRDKAPILFPGEGIPILPEKMDPVSGEGEVNFSTLRYVGQVGGTYLIFAADGNMIMLDQHAAHERIIFENLKRHDADKDHLPHSQRLLMPEIMSLPPGDIQFLVECLPALERCGFALELFGSDTVVLKAVPSFLSTLDVKKIITDFVGEFSDKEMASLDYVKEKIFAFLACRGAVKAHHVLSHEEVAALCRELDKTPAMYSCPHGRPIFVSFTHTALEKLFKRR